MSYAASVRAMAALTALWALTGCAALTALGDASAPLDVYELRAPGNIQTVRNRPLPVDVIVELPTTSGALETDRIMIRPSPLQAEYLPGARWGEDAPVMIQTLLVRSIETTQGVRYVARRPLGAGGDYAIVSELIDFQADVNEDEKTATVRFRIVSRIVREDGVRIIASRAFSASALVPSLENHSIVEGFDAAAARLLPEFSEWVLVALGSR